MLVLPLATERNTSLPTLLSGHAIYAPISVVKNKRGEGGGDRATHGNLTVAYSPRVVILIGHHAFDLSILYSRREANFCILTILFCPGVGILIIFFRKFQNPHPMPDLPPLGVTLIDALLCIHSATHSPSPPPIDKEG